MWRLYIRNVSHNLVSPSPVSPIYSPFNVEHIKLKLTHVRSLYAEHTGLVVQKDTNELLTYILMFCNVNTTYMHNIWENSFVATHTLGHMMCGYTLLIEINWKSIQQIKQWA